MRFAKYHGIGNDFVLFADPDDGLELTPGLVRALCDRRFGIGADGVIRVAPGRDGTELFMDYVNSDGSIGEMCGNGIRCLALFALEEGLVGARTIAVGTRAGPKTVWLTGDGRVRVDMGPPAFAPGDVPVVHHGSHALDVELELDGAVLEAACLSMGNPHAVIFVDEPADVPLEVLGPRIESHPLFPAKTNVAFAVVEEPGRVRVRVWERGAGQTLACGTGACASAVAARLLRGAAARVVVALPGGELEVSWDGSLEERAPVFLTGPAVRAFDGEVDLEAYR